MRKLLDLVVGISVILGTLFGGLTLYYTAAVFYGWKPDGETMFSTDWRLAAWALFGIVVLTMSFLLLAIRLGWFRSGRQPQDGLGLRPLMEAFQVAAGEETSLALLLYVEKISLPANPTPAKHVYDRKLLSVAERDQWRESLKKLDKECERLGLEATHAAILQAIARFDDTQINRVTAYWAYHSVSLALKDEIERVGKFVHT